jgi:glycosylphosphatidylinositol deacylase
MLASAPAALLHAHASAPYLASPRRGVELSLHASGEVGCGPGAVDITLDWPATVGRWAPRLWPALVSSSVGITALVLLDALTLAEHSTGK